MKLLALSDIQWGPIGLSGSRPPGYPGTFCRLKRIVEEVRPDAVLIAGDLVDDKFGNREEYWDQLRAFIAYLAGSSIPVLAVRGNWDESDEYKSLQVYSGFEDISERLVKFRGVTILGVSYQATRDIRYMRGLATRYPQRIGIVIAHALFRRRPWLYLLRARMILSGHYDTMLGVINNKLVLSMWQSPDTYAVINTRPYWKIKLVVTNPVLMPHAYSRVALLPALHKHPVCATGVIKKGIPSCHRQGPVFGAIIARPRYVKEMEALIAARRTIQRGYFDQQTERARLKSLGVPAAQVEEFLAQI